MSLLSCDPPGAKSNSRTNAAARDLNRVSETTSAVGTNTQRLKIAFGFLGPKTLEYESLEP